MSLKKLNIFDFTKKKNSTFVTTFKECVFSVSDHSTVEQVKKYVIGEYTNKFPGAVLDDPDNYVVKVTGLNYFLTDEHLPLFVIAN